VVQEVGLGSCAVLIDGCLLGYSVPATTVATMKEPSDKSGAFFLPGCMVMISMYAWMLICCKRLAALMFKSPLRSLMRVSICICIQNSVRVCITVHTMPVKSASNRQHQCLITIHGQMFLSFVLVIPRQITVALLTQPWWWMAAQVNVAAVYTLHLHCEGFLTNTVVKSLSIQNPMNLYLLAPNGCFSQAVLFL